MIRHFYSKEKKVKCTWIMFHKIRFVFVPQVVSTFLLFYNFRVMIYNGQMDIIIAWPLTENFITSMKWSKGSNYTGTPRTLWHVGGELAGYVKQVGDFTQVLVRNAGHMVPYDQPKWAFDLINRFTSGKKFE